MVDEEGKSKIIQTMSDISGLDRFDVEGILACVQANHDVLDGCEYHNFSIDLIPKKMFGKRWKCTRCGGEVNALAKYWYELGLLHATHAAQR